VTFPHLGSYCVPFEVLFKTGLEVDYVVPPPITARTLALGSLHSPDFVCSPFKYNLGNYIESIEAGANTLLQVGGVCRLGYYGELHEQILKDLGYDVHFINLAKEAKGMPQSLFAQLKYINPNMKLTRIARIVPLVLKMVEHIDEVEDYVRRHVGFELKTGAIERAHAEYLEELRRVDSFKTLKRARAKVMKRLAEIPTEKPINPLRVGIVGEYYTIMVPFSNHYVEKELAKMGMVVDRWMNVSNSVLHNRFKEQSKRSRGYVQYDMGATAMMTIERALTFAREGYDGIIQVKSFGCTPEMDVIPVLQNISADYKIPIIYLSFDSQTSETGIKTRLEAFYDMVVMRKEKK
jgi:predicted nucleotide-binding protein (sugar kinase/HSP70/actin superfamily)